tara:strand:+ start:7646 stop:8551 length:906 start_codon:yes stop_codon:yes gene_type:complete
MALQSNGSISISDVKTELGSSSYSLTSLSTSASKTAPHGLKEFYGYTHSTLVDNDYYWKGDGVNDTLRNSGSSIGWNTSTDLSWSGWYRIDSGGGAVEQLGSISTSTPSGSNQVFLQFHGGFNRIFLRVRVNGTFGQRQYPLHDNSSITGVSSAGWKSTNRGNVNSDGFAHFTFTYDASDTSSNAFQFYWNGAQLTSSVNNQSGTRSSSWTAGSFAIADIISSTTNNPNVFQGGVDQVSMYDKVLSQSEITALYNSGTPITGTDASVTSNLLGEYRLENNANNSASTFPNLTNTGGTFTSY